jgi:cation diffusion facilitator family transporter
LNYEDEVKSMAETNRQPEQNRSHRHGADNEQHDHNEPDAHDHENDHEHDHAQKGIFGKIFGGLIHSHSHGDDDTGKYMEESARGIWALKISLVGLGITAAFQVVIVIISGSAALLADTIHNFTDAMTAIPLWVAFVMGRRLATRRYTYGYGRAEDLAGLFVVLVILASAVIAFFESLDKLINPRPIDNLGWVIVAAIVGFIGNEAVALFRIKIGKEIGSEALVADGLHARTDGLTSLAVLFGAIGVMLGYPQADPIVGLFITGIILLVLRNAALSMYRRMMDAVEPSLVERIEKVASAVKGVIKVDNIRGRWNGHRLFAELSVEVDGNLNTFESHAIGETVRHDLWHKIPRLADIIVHIDPVDVHGNGNAPYHATNEHHLDPIFKRIEPAK